MQRPVLISSAFRKAVIRSTETFISKIIWITCSKTLTQQQQINSSTAAPKEDELTKQKKKRAALEAAQQNSELQPEQQCEIESLDVEICRLEQAIESCGDSPLLPVQGGATLHGINLVAKKGSITLLQGPVGCGKSTLLQGILNEVPLEAGCLTLAGPSVAFCSQEPFILHSTVKDNIVFGRPWNAKRYKMALEACALIADISTLAEAKATRQKLERKVSIYLVDKRLG